MSGSYFLKISGILMIIFGTLKTVLYGLLLLSIFFFESPFVVWNITVGGYIPVAFLSLGAAVLELACGIFGVKNCDEFDKAKECIVFAAFVISLLLLSAVLAFLGAYPVNWLLLLVQMVLPVLFIIGGARNY